MSLEIVREDKSKESSCPPFIDLVNNSVIYFFMGLSFIVAPYAGKRIQEIGSKFLCQKPEKSNLKAITPKTNKHNIKNNDILFELLRIMSKARIENIPDLDSAVDCSKQMSNLIFNTDYYVNRFHSQLSLEKAISSYNKNYTRSRIDWIDTEIDGINKTQFLLPKISLTNLFGIKIININIKSNSPYIKRYTKAIGTYIITDLNITDEIIDELFEIQEKINDLNKDLQKYMNDDSVDEEIVQAVRGSIKIGEEKAQSIIEALSKQAQTDKKEKELELYHKALSTNW